MASHALHRFNLRRVTRQAFCEGVVSRLPPVRPLPRRTVSARVPGRLLTGPVLMHQPPHLEPSDGNAAGAA